MSTAARLAIDWVERGYIPDAVIRRGIRRLCGHRLRELCAGDCDAAAQLTEAFVRAMDVAETAPLPQLANEQHYAVFLAGLRPSEAAARVWSDLDPVAGTLAIYSSRVLNRTGATKTAGSVRTIRLVPELREILRAIRPPDVDPGASIFVGPNGVTIDQDRLAWRQWIPTLRALQIRPRRLPAAAPV